MVTVGVLGEVEVLVDGVRRAIPGGKTSEVLVRLALEPGTLVRADRIIQDLWGDEGEAASRNTLQSKVSRLRRVFGDAMPIVGTPAGYTLAIDHDDVDASRVLRLAEAATDAERRRDPARVLEHCADALSCFTGDLLVDAGDGAWVAPHRARLTEVRVCLLELQMAARLDLGAAGELVGELEELVALHPLRESLWASLMRALYRARRQADALAAYTRVRHILAEELGLAPGPALADLERRILLQDDQLGGADAPAASDQQRPRHNLPSLAGPLVGRLDDLAELALLLKLERLVTIVGPAGVGKTRLAIEAAREVDRPGGVWLVRLDSARDAADVTPAIAKAFGLGPTTESELVEHLRGVDALIVLDNCEQILDAVADVVTRLLDASPGLGLLCTSQASLGLDGETVHQVAPLSVAEAVELFVVRAAAVPRPTDMTAAVEAVCHALDGLPLAIELAAARTGTLPVGEIARRLDDRFALLADPTGRRPDRHRTLRAAIGWSYDLLDPADQVGLGALATFLDGAPLDATEFVLARLGVPAVATLDIVSRLADRSLITTDHDGDHARYRLLDSIRAYAIERLDQAGLGESARRANADWYAEVATTVGGMARGPEQAGALALARRERANIDQALAWSADEAPAIGLTIANGFGWAWFVLGDSDGGARRCAAARVAAGDHAPIDAQIANLQLSAWLSSANNVDQANIHAERAITLAKTQDDRLVAASSVARAFVLLQQGRAAEAHSELDGCPELHGPAGDVWDRAAALVLQAYAALATGNLGAAALACEQASPLIGGLGDDWAGGHLEGLLGMLAQSQDRYLDASGHLRRAADASERLGFRGVRALHLANLGRVLQLAADDAGALDALTEAIDVGREIRDLRTVALARVRLGRLLRAMGDHDGARAALAAADHWYRGAGGGDGAKLAACLSAAIDAETGDAHAVDRLYAVLDDARASGEHDVEVLALDAIARRHAVAGESAAALELLALADEGFASVGHLVIPADRVDATAARALLST